MIMIELKLIRKYLKKDYTIGKLYINDVYFCDTLEDTVRDISKGNCTAKIYGRTAIPSGTYDVVYGYSPKYKKLMPRLIDVPCFTGILIHPGNTHSDTDGCILVGQNKQVGKVLNSRTTFDKLIQRIIQSNNNTDKQIKITIV